MNGATETPDEGKVLKFIAKAGEYRKAADDLALIRKDIEENYANKELKPLAEALLNHQQIQVESNWDKALLIIKAIAELISNFLQSGIFYFFSGLALLFYAVHSQQAPGSSSMHPSLLFLIAILGVALLLFGTGSQSSGAIATAGAGLPGAPAASDGKPPPSSSLPADHPIVVAEDSIKAVQSALTAANEKPTETEKVTALSALTEPVNAAVKAAADARNAANQNSVSTPPATSSDWGPIKANAAIAGGAAVLAALFGWGVVSYGPGIKQVFSRDDHYEKVYINACAAYTQFCSSSELPEDSILAKNFKLDDYEISAKLDFGSRIPVFKDDKRITLVLLSEDARNSTFFWLTINRISGADHSETFRQSFYFPVRLRANPTKPSKDDAPQNCIRFEGAPNNPCELSAMILDEQISSEDKAKIKMYSLNFFGKPNTAGIRTIAATVPGQSDAPAVAVDFDLGSAGRTIQ